MRTFSLAELKEQGLEIAKLEGVNKLIVSTDGQFFTEANRSHALRHKSITPGVELHEVEYTLESIKKHIITQEDLDNNPDLVDQGVKVGDEIEIDAEAKSTQDENVKKTTEEMISEISKLEDIAAIVNYMEKVGKNKKVKAAAEKRMDEIKAAQAEAERK